MKSILVFASLFFVLASCTRETPTTSDLTLVIPQAKTLTASSQLQTVIVNVHIPGRPTVVRELEFREGGGLTPPTLGQPISVQFDKLPVAQNVLVQFLGVFQNVNGTIQFTYGDAVTNLSAGTASANIKATQLPSSSKMGHVAGRIYTNATGGPSGNLIAYFNPGNGRPEMKVERTYIYNGWFNVFVLENSSISYVLEPSGIRLFENLNLNHAMLNSASQQVVKMASPATYQENEVNPATDFVLGFFATAASGVNLASHEACFVNNYDEAVMGVFTDSQKTSPLTYYYASVNSGDLRKVSGGSAKSFAQAHSPTGSCDRSTGTKLVFYPNLVRNREEFGGFRGPFMKFNGLANEGGYVSGQYLAGSPNKIRLKWKYLPGANQGIDGLKLFSKFNPNGSGGNEGGKIRCSDLPMKGFQFATDIPAALETFDFDGAGGINTSNFYNYSFALCPYKNEFGQQFTSNDVIMTGNLFGEGDSLHFGWGVASPSIGASESFAVGGGVLGGKFAKATGITTPNAGFTNISHGTVTGPAFVPGNEVFIWVVGRGQSNSCGNFNGIDISPGAVYPARILDSSGSYITVQSGPYDQLINLNATEAVGNAYCFAQVVEVPHFKNLTIGNSIILSANYFGGSGGGIVAFRANGITTMNDSGSTIESDAKGFSKSNLTNKSGAGYGGPNETTGQTFSGGQFLAGSGGGGAGYGRGGDGASSGGQGGTNANPFGTLSLVMGGAGASATTASGNGGGAIFVASRQINVNGGIIKSYGEGGAGSGASGGGGGGSILLASKKMVGSGFNIIAHGGTGGNTSGGVGGGGYIKAWLCDTTGVSLNVTNLKGASGNQTNAQDGNPDSLVPANQIWFCNQ